jgi:putative aldouronate transport system substrate-binding protein
MTSAFERSTTPTGFSRRGFLGLSFASLGAFALAACSTGGGGVAGAGGAGEIRALLPDYIPFTIAEPTFPSVDGSTAGYTEWPAQLADATSQKPGKGSTFTAIAAVYSIIPPSVDSNSYYQALNDALGARIELQPSDSGEYEAKLQAILASPRDVPDWVAIPSSTTLPRFDQAVDALFEDLTPFLAGEAVKDYPNLANITTDTWRYCVFNGKLMALPFPAELIGSQLYFRVDILDELGLAQPTSADELFEVAQVLTDPGAGRWAANDIFENGLDQVFRVPQTFSYADGELLGRLETEEYRLAIAFQQRLVESGLVHPNAAASNGNPKERFEAGQVGITVDGLGGWRSATRRLAPVDPEYRQAAATPFAHDGGDPVVWKANPANMNSFIKKSDDKERIREQLRIADWLASPFGSKEWVLANFGVEGEHWDPDPATGAPVSNENGLKFLSSGYRYLTSPNTVDATVAYPDYVDEFTTWMTNAVKYVKEGDFWGQRILEPAQFNSLKTLTDDFEADVLGGRATVDDLDGVIENWRAQGGDQLRDFYAETAESLGIQQ